MIQSVLVVGGGSAGFLAALAIKKSLPHVSVRVVRSKEIGVIGVGESTTLTVPRMLHGFLDLDPGEFYRLAMPSWKLGIRFLWGPRPFFDYTFDLQMDWKWSELARPNGYFCDEEMSYVNNLSALMSHNKVFTRQPNGLPHIMPYFGYHIENRRFVAYLEATAARRGIDVIDDIIEGATQDDRGVSGVKLASGRTLTADLYLDCTGFRSLLLKGTLGEPFRSYASTLFCDRAVVGSWMRSDETIRPYTTAETMSAGWCWQIDHPDCINRGYVYSSAFISDEEAEREYRSLCPKAENIWRVQYVSGRYERSWVKNVVAIGNASGFVEPLESTALAIICDMSRILGESLREGNREPTPLLMSHYNQLTGRAWDTIRDFLGIHYKFNTRYDTPFWRAARADTVLGPIQNLVDYYQDQGPTTFYRFNMVHANDMFGMEGYLSLLVGQKVPYRLKYTPTEEERHLWMKLRAQNQTVAENGFSVRDALNVVMRPECKWRPGFFKFAEQSRLTSYISSLA